MRYYTTLILLLLTAVTLRAQMPARSLAFCDIPPVDSTLVRGEAARDNLWPGFGTGSRRQADMPSATAFRTADILGVALTGVGAVGLVATALQRNLGQASMFSSPSNVPYYVFGGLIATGVATVTVSRIKAVKQARAYDLVIFPAVGSGGTAGAGIGLQF